MFRWILMLGALLAAGPASLAAQRSSDQIERPEVRKLVIKGVHAVDRDELLQSIATDESGCRSLLFAFLCPFYKGDAVYEHAYLDEKEFQRDVLRIKVFYWKRGYREAQVDTTVSPRGGKKVTVTFRVTEGPPTLVQRVEVRRPEALLSDRTMRRLVLVRAGRAFNTLQLDTTLLRLRQAMWQRGYADAVVTQTATVDSATHTVRVALDVVPNARAVVGTIHVHGNEDISEKSIRRSLFLKPGDVFRLDEMVRSQRALYESGLFRRAALFAVTSGAANAPCSRFNNVSGQAIRQEEVEAAEDSAEAAEPDSVKRVEVCVQEAPLHDVRASTGFNTVDYIQVEGRYSQYNFLGGARRLDVQGTVGNLLSQQLNGRIPFRRINDVTADADAGRYFAPTWQASADVRQRWFHSARNTLGAGIFAHRRSAPGIFVDRGYGVSSTFTREVALNVPASATYRFEIATVEAGDVYFCVNYGVCDRPTINALRARQRLSPLIISSAPDKANDPFSPTSGWRGRFEADHASAFTMSDFRYNRVFTEGSVYRRLGRRGTIATRVRLGFVRALASTEAATGVTGALDGDILHPRKRFYAGGAQSVRGFGENMLGPKVLTIAANDLRGEGNSRCAAADIRDCDPNGVDPATGNTLYSERDFIPRPLGANSLVEANVEVRFPIRGNFVGAAFVDGGWLSGRVVGGNTTRSDGALTPGIGVRYRSPVGPIRVDLGFNPFLRDSLTVITEDTTGGTRRLVRLHQQRDYQPGRNSKGLNALFDRLTLHLSIGEAF